MDWIWKVGTLGVLVVVWKNEGMAVAYNLKKLLLTVYIEPWQREVTLFYS